MTPYHAYSGSLVYVPDAYVVVSGHVAYSGSLLYIPDANRVASPHLAYSGPFQAIPSTNVIGAIHFLVIAVGTVHVGDNLAPVGVLGRFAAIGPEVMNRVFLRPRQLQLTSVTDMVILGPTPGDTGGDSVLTLDFAQHAMPFAWAVVGVPPLLTMDWAASAMPFASNFQVIDPVLGALHLMVVAAADMNVTTTIVSAPLQFLVKAEMSLGEAGQLGSLSFSVVAECQLGAESQPVGRLAFLVKADAAADGRVFIKGALSLLVTASTVEDGEVRDVKLCELPGAIIHLTSNLPEGVWQPSWDAQFYWEEIWVCTRDPVGERPVEGYFWKLTTDEIETAWWDWESVPIPGKTLDLRDYGRGSWWFHVAAWTDVGIGPTAKYNVKYNNRPSGPGDIYMRVDLIDTLRQTPLIAYSPPTPHVFDWSPSDDLDGDSIVYLLEIALSADFIVDPISGEGIVLQRDSIPENNWELDQLLDPKVYFWRIRAFDGSEYSEWSPVGSFRVNHPPDDPTELGVTQLT